MCLLRTHAAIRPASQRPCPRQKELACLSSSGRITPEHAGRKSWRKLPGVGMSADAADLVAPTIEGPAAAVRACLADANLSVADVDYINAHGTGTVANDIAEIRVIKSVFGHEAKHLSISSTKSMHGHALGASGALELSPSSKQSAAGLCRPLSISKSSIPNAILM